MNSITSPAHVLGQLNPDEVAHIVQASADISLTLNRDGVIQSIAFGNPDLRSPSLESWVGKNWLDVVTSESRFHFGRDARAQTCRYFLTNAC